jgi:hypothetical protein
MALKTGIFSLALGTLLLGSTARADDNQFQAQQYGDDTQAQAEGFRGGYGQVHVHTDACRHGPQPAPPQGQQGRYELRDTQQWVPGRYQQVWVPEQCRFRPRHGYSTCRAGYYDQQWVEGHYETTQQWVWVPYRWNRNTGSEWGTPVNYYRW